MEPGDPLDRRPPHSASAPAPVRIETGPALERPDRRTRAVADPAVDRARIVAPPAAVPAAGAEPRTRATTLSFGGWVHRPDPCGLTPGFWRGQRTVPPGPGPAPTAPPSEANIDRHVAADASKQDAPATGQGIEARFAGPCGTSRRVPGHSQTYAACGPASPRAWASSPSPAQSQLPRPS